MSGPQNAVVGDLDQPTDIPSTQVSDDILEDERKVAKYSKTAEFQRLKQFMEERIVFYQHFLPDGRPIKETDKDLDVNWRVANIVIGEFKTVLNVYAQAAEEVANYDKR